MVQLYGRFNGLIRSAKEHRTDAHVLFSHVINAFPQRLGAFMKLPVLALTVATLALLTVEAQAETRVRQPLPPTQYSPYSENIYGPNRSGVAPSTAVPQGRSTFIVPAPRGAGTGGTHD